MLPYGEKRKYIEEEEEIVLTDTDVFLLMILTWYVAKAFSGDPYNPIIVTFVRDVGPKYCV